MERFDLTAETDPAFVCVRGDTYEVVEFEWLDASTGDPVDLTDTEMTVQIRDQIAGNILAVGRTSGAPAAPGGVPTFVITVHDATAGKWRWEQMPPSVTVALLDATARRNAMRWYDNEITFASGVVKTPFCGKIEVTPDVTR